MIRVRANESRGVTIEADEPVRIEVTGVGWEVDGVYATIHRAGEDTPAVRVDTALLPYPAEEWEVSA